MAKINLSGLVITTGESLSKVDPELTLEFTRANSRPSKIRREDSHFERRNGAPKRIRSTMPSPGAVELNLCIGEKIGSGRTGIVYAAVPDAEYDVDGVASRYPPLAVKVAKLGRRRFLARDAWFYEELECFQGSSIARCYGFFDAVLPAGEDLLPWREALVDDIDSDEDEAKAATWDPLHPKVVTILVLERLGDRIPLGKPLPAGAR